ncbi:MAG: flavodoxin [Magnetovibrio sp.]|nr:flavodoxin [Magnetovibrio sp.]|tara:strand:+ start:504 stop:971 length:468 start_codon:yes stop_codon:yes gene_type:complete
MNKKLLLVVAHKPSPNTENLAKAVMRGCTAVETKNVEVTCLSPFDATPNDVLSCSAIILGTTENLGYMSGAIKDFFDRIYYPCIEHTQGLPYALYVRAGLDGTGARRSVETVVKGLRWRSVQEPMVLQGNYKVVFADQCCELGMAMSVGLETGIF